MKTLIVGYGEVGQALHKVLQTNYQVFYLDKDDPLAEEYKDLKPEIMHITFGYSPNFIQYVKEYQEKYKPKYTIIHSTVPVGTTRKVNGIHSPIRGLHPNLESGIHAFPKFIGGEAASEVADYFRRCDIKVVLFDKPETTEAMKLWDTTYYGVCIDFAKRVKEYCDKHNLNFHEVYTLANQTYNEGYQALGHPEFTRPVLQPIMTTKIGGHCVNENRELLKESE